MPRVLPVRTSDRFVANRLTVNTTRVSLADHGPRREALGAPFRVPRLLRRRCRRRRDHDDDVQRGELHGHREFDCVRFELRRSAMRHEERARSESTRRQRRRRPLAALPVAHHVSPTRPAAPTSFCSGGIMLTCTATTVGIITFTGKSSWCCLVEWYWRANRVARGVHTGVPVVAPSGRCWPRRLGVPRGRTLCVPGPCRTISRPTLCGIGTLPAAPHIHNTSFPAEPSQTRCAQPLKTQLLSSRPALTRRAQRRATASRFRARRARARRASPPLQRLPPCLR